MRLLSVIIPVYNVENYLERCVLSVVFQTYTNIEIILVDDGSKDSSGQICDELAEKFTRINVYHKENGGLSDARNYGIERSKGDYITFLDSDDCLHPDMYSILISQLENYNADIAESRYRRVYQKLPPVQKCETATVIILDPKEALLSNYDWEYFPSVVWNKVYTREVIANVRFPVGRYHEDEFFIYEVLYHAKKLVHIAADLHYYQQRSGSIMSDLYHTKHFDAVDAYKQRLIFFKEREPDVYQKGCLHFVDHLIKQMLQILSYSNGSWTDKKDLFYLYGKECCNLDQDILDIYNKNSKNEKNKQLLRFARIHPYILKLYYNLMMRRMTA